MTASLPSPAPEQAYIHVSALEAGLLRLPARLFVKDVPPSESHVCPSLAFSLRHSKNNSHLLFDLGIRKDTTTYPPFLQSFIRDVTPVSVPQDVAESLTKGGISAADINTVILSHLHWDHIGDCSLFPNATFVVGEESREVLEPTDADTLVFADIPRERIRFLRRSQFSIPVATFPHAFDYFGDGSLYIIDAPGHLNGHINVLARTSPHGAWIYLGGDTCHDLRLLTGEKRMFYETDVTGKVISCLHVDKDKAEEHIRRVGELQKIRGVHVLMAHDWQWYEQNKGGPAFLPGSVPAITL